MLGRFRHSLSERTGLAMLAAATTGLLLVWMVIRMFGGGRIEPGLLAEVPDQSPQPAFGVVLSESFPVHREVIGSIQSRAPIEAASRYAATVISVEVRAGDRVKRGQVIVGLDAAELRAQLAAARGQLAAAKSELRRTAADHKRYSALYTRGSVTASERDHAEAAYRAAIGTAAQAEAAVAGARAALAYASVRSPVDGVVVERFAEPGDMAMPGKPLVRLYDEHALRVELQVPEDLARSIALGTSVQVAVNEATYSSRVNEIVPASDPLSRSFLVRAPMPSGAHLQPGMFARATFTVGTGRVLTVPRRAIEQVGQLDTARVISGGRIETRMIALGRPFGDRIEVLAGLHAGQRVLLDDSAMQSQ
jgi:membrane fusion protein (multidrug efflux system)